MDLGKLSADMDNIVLHLFALVRWKALSPVLGYEVNLVFPQEVWTNLFDVAFGEIVDFLDVVD